MQEKTAAIIGLHLPVTYLLPTYAYLLFTVRRRCQQRTAAEGTRPEEEKLKRERGVRVSSNRNSSASSFYHLCDGGFFFLLGDHSPSLLPRLLVNKFPPSARASPSSQLCCLCSLVYCLPCPAESAQLIQLIRPSCPLTTLNYVQHLMSFSAASWATSRTKSLRCSLRPDHTRDCPASLQRLPSVSARPVVAP